MGLDSREILTASNVCGITRISITRMQCSPTVQTGVSGSGWGWGDGGEIMKYNCAYGNTKALHKGHIFILLVYQRELNPHAARQLLTYA